MNATRSLYEIGPLRLDPEARVLTHAGAPLALGARAIAVLTTLVGQAQEYVSKAAILDAAWPGLVVEEANLAVQISAIRRALARVPGGDGWIETLARRGYRFVGPVVAVADPRAAATVDRTRTNLPQLLTSFVGRERELAELKQRLPSTRMLTLTGTGGIGKTRLALQAAAEVREAYRDGAWFVDLSPLVDPTLVPSAVAQVLGVKEAAGQPLQATLCAHLRGKEVLLILDNCEQVLAAVADLAEELLRATAKVTLVATSREPLHVGGEHIYPVTALPVPGRTTDAKGIARSDAVQLFVERAKAHRPSFDLEGSRARAVADICVRLDGIPLALELAAARVAVLPVEQIVRLLDQRFRLLSSGSRSDVPRHQTLRAMLDWSYDLLDENEQKLLARFSVFAGGFTLAAAEVVAAGDTIAKDDVVLSADRTGRKVAGGRRRGRRPLPDAGDDAAVRRRANWPKRRRRDAARPDIATTSWRWPRRPNRNCRDQTKSNGCDASTWNTRTCGQASTGVSWNRNRHQVCGSAGRCTNSGARAGISRRAGTGANGSYTNPGIRVERRNTQRCSVRRACWPLFRRTIPPLRHDSWIPWRSGVNWATGRAWSFLWPTSEVWPSNRATIPLP